MPITSADQADVEGGVLAKTTDRVQDVFAVGSLLLMGGFADITRPRLGLRHQQPLMRLESCVK